MVDASLMTPRAVATLLLRIGTLPFLAMPVALHFLPSEHARIRVAMVCYAGTILTFIGGLQQAAAVSTPSLTSTPLVAFLAIVIALSAMTCILSASLMAEIVSWEAAEVELKVLCAAYIIQIWFERVFIPRSTRHAMLYMERRPSMVIAAMAMLLTIPRPLGPFTLLALCGAIAACADLLFNLSKPDAAFGAVAIGTTNACKVAAARRALAMYPEVYAGTPRTLYQYSVPSGVDDQPIGMEVTARGARNRAYEAYHHERHRASVGAMHARLLGVGIESGLFALDGRYYDVCIVSAYDGTTHHYGLSCAFQIPPRILKYVTNHGKDLSQACRLSGISSDPKLGEHGGLIGLLSSNRLTREDYTLQALETALFFALEASNGKKGQPKWFADDEHDGDVTQEHAQEQRVSTAATRRGRSPARSGRRSKTA